MAGRMEVENVQRGFEPGTSISLRAIYDSSIKLDDAQRAMRKAILEMSDSEQAALLDRYNVEQRDQIDGQELAMALNAGAKGLKPKKSKAKPAEQPALVVMVASDEDMEEAE